MRSSRLEKSPCTICGRSTGLFTCRGCEKDFCTRHVAEHRQMLNKEVDELTNIYDRFRQTLSNQTAQSHEHPLIKQIDQWEEQSIKKIRLAAKNTRQQLQKLISQHTAKSTDVLTKTSHDLRKAREDGHFFETDLKEWTEKLNKLKSELTEIPNVCIQEEDDKINSFISKIFVFVPTKDTFETSIGNIRIEEHGQLIVKDLSDNYATVRGNGEYTSGQHRFRLKIQPNHPNKWLFIGIISKDMSLQAISYECPSSYGWAGIDRVFLNGIFNPGFNNYSSDLETNDVVELMLDCDQQMINLTNERTHRTFELNIDINNCPFPWQLNFNLYWANGHVRLLPT